MQRYYKSVHEIPDVLLAAERILASEDVADSAAEWQRVGNLLRPALGCALDLLGKTLSPEWGYSEEERLVAASQAEDAADLYLQVERLSNGYSEAPGVANSWLRRRHLRRRHLDD